MYIVVQTKKVYIYLIAEYINEIIYKAIFTSTASIANLTIFASILSLLDPNLTMPKFLRHVATNLRCSFQSSPSEHIRPDVRQ